MRRFALLLSIASLPMLACGSVAVGGSCNTVGFLCADVTAALECKNGLWVKLPCKGTNGCKHEGDVVTCDMSSNDEGDNCSSSAQGTGLCAKDLKGILECREGKLVKTHICRSCAVTNDQVICTP